MPITEEIYEILYEDADQRSQGTVVLEENIEPGESVEIPVTVKGFANGGLHPVKLFWYIASGGRRTAGNPVDLRIAVLTNGQEPQDLLAESASTQSAPPAETVIAPRTARVIQVPPYPAASETIQSQPGDRLEARNLLWVPLLIPCRHWPCW